MFLRGILLALPLAACSHNSVEPKKDYKTAIDPSIPLDYSLADDVDFETGIFQEGQDHRFSRAFEVPSAVEKEEEAKAKALKEENEAEVEEPI